ncbi:hypothetical protein Shin27_0400 [Escherichia coli phage Shin27]|nr:hypothetical protein Shin27_0400 [Escherichia coli phage Shin27]
MAVRILRYVERKETDIMQHHLTDGQYAQFLEMQKSGASTAALGAWINSVSTCTHFDSYGYTPAETVQIFDDYEKEYIAD